jgi:hypothetical protein
LHRKQGADSGLCVLTLIALAGLLDALRQADARLAGVAWRLQTANVAVCSVVAPLPGFSVETIDQYVPSERAEARAAFGLGDRPQISAVVTGSSADRAGLKAGDEIVAVNGVAIPPTQAGRVNYDRTAAVEAALNAALEHPPVTLSLPRGSALLTGDAGCASTVQLVPGGRFDASADGRYGYGYGNRHESWGR